MERDFGHALWPDVHPLWADGGRVLTDGDWRGDAARRILIDEIGGRPPSPPVLVVGPGSDAVLDALVASGLEAVRWRRWVEPGNPVGAFDSTQDDRPGPWPPDGPFASAILRLPRAKDELEMVAHALFARMKPGGSLLIYGAKDEGIASAQKRLEGVLGSGGSIRTLSVKARCRVIELRRGDHAPDLQGEPDDWILTGSMDMGAGPRSWVSFPGLFAAGRLDPGTSLLLGALPPIRGVARVLDYGCGTGVIGAAVLARAPGAAVDLLDADALALEAARRNVPDASRFILSSSIAGIEGPYDAIVSNPPFHEGKSETLRVLEDLIGRAPRVLSRKGTLTLVTQSRIPVAGTMEGAFRRVESLAQDSVFRVWHGSAPRSGP